MLGRISACLLGTAMGATAVLLTAPQSGKRTRDLIRNSAGRIARNASRLSLVQKRGVVKALEAGSRAYRQAVSY